MEIIVLIGIIVAVYLFSRYGREFFPKKYESVADVLSEELERYKSELELRTKLAKHSNRIKSKELMDIANNHALGYNELREIAKKHKII